MGTGPLTAVCGSTLPFGKLQQHEARVGWTGLWLRQKLYGQEGDYRASISGTVRRRDEERGKERVGGANAALEVENEGDFVGLWRSLACVDVQGRPSRNTSPGTPPKYVSRHHFACCVHHVNGLVSLPAPHYSPVMSHTHQATRTDGLQNNAGVVSNDVGTRKGVERDTEETQTLPRRSFHFLFQAIPTPLLMAPALPLVRLAHSTTVVNQFKDNPYRVVDQLSHPATPLRTSLCSCLIPLATSRDVS